MKRLNIYHIGTNKKTLCGRISVNYIVNDKGYEDIKEIIKVSKTFMNLCKICDTIKKKEYNES